MYTNLALSRNLVRSVSSMGHFPLCGPSGSPLVVGSSIHKKRNINNGNQLSTRLRLHVHQSRISARSGRTEIRDPLTISFFLSKDGPVGTARLARLYTSGSNRFAFSLLRLIALMGQQDTNILYSKVTSLRRRALNLIRCH